MIDEKERKYNNHIRHTNLYGNLRANHRLNLHDKFQERDLRVRANGFDKTIRKEIRIGPPRIDPPVDRSETRTVNDTGIVESNNESRYSPCSSHPHSSSFDA